MFFVERLDKTTIYNAKSSRNLPLDCLVLLLDGPGQHAGEHNADELQVSVRHSHNPESNT